MASINTEELAKLYRQSSAKPLLVDVRQEWEYRTGYIKGAVNFPQEPDRGPAGGRPGHWRPCWGRTGTALLVFY